MCMPIISTTDRQRGNNNRDRTSSSMGCNEGRWPASSSSFVQRSELLVAITRVRGVVSLNPPFVCSLFVVGWCLVGHSRVEGCWFGVVIEYDGESDRLVKIDKQFIICNATFYSPSHHSGSTTHRQHTLVQFCSSPLNHRLALKVVVGRHCQRIPIVHGEW